MSNSNFYFAALPVEDIGEEIVRRARDYNTYVITTGLSARIRKSYRFHYGYTNSGNSSYEIGSSGEQGELSVAKVNHYANIATNLKGLITANRPALIPVATNSDVKSQGQTILGAGVLDYYIREKRVERIWNQAVEHALLFGAAWVKIEWDPAAGEEVGVEDVEDVDLDAFGNPTGEATLRQQLIMSGDLNFSVHSPFDVIIDTNKKDTNFSWVTIRTFKNKYELAAKYKPFADEILSISGNDEYEAYNELRLQTDINILQVSEKEEIPVYEFFHKISDALPQGRHVIVLPTGTVLYEGALPIKTLPVLRIAMREMIESPHGWTTMFDLLGLQEALDILNSQIFTNQEKWGGANIAVPKSADIDFTNLGAGGNMIEYNPEMVKLSEIGPLNLLATAPELFQNRREIEQYMETLSGVNSVVRGNPTAAAGASGASQALVYAQALQFVNTFQQNYNALLEDTGTTMFQYLKTYASRSRTIAAITGKSQRYLTKTFTKEDISEINRVTVDVTNPLSKTHAGRIQMAEDLLNKGLIKTAEQYFMVLATGKLESMVEAQQTELLNIRAENELLGEGGMPSVFALDNHSLHIREHSSVVNSPEARKDIKVMEATWQHIQDHMFTWRNTDPELLMIVGQQPPETPAPQGMTGPAAPPDSMGGPSMGPMMDNANPVEAEMPGQPNLPTNPATGETVELANPDTQLPPELG